MAKTNLKILWSKWLLYIFWGVLSVFALSLVGMFGADMLTQTQADTGTTISSDMAHGRDFSSYICGPVMGAATGIIGVLAILMLVVAGITYATSMGGSGASNAKEMIMAAITGVAFFLIARSLIVGNCGGDGGLLQHILNQTLGS
ncbi:hypothetical protein DRH29_00155 [candidate division Kazan bacterium]|uniref:Uncharacterized protein n=1 Tax=candidate division Kazan bacterium TaxID=2202143 RepID=A0A420ZDP7_UNCK3|nr:MAG: hypothetical protein DRH29_00155 [candidate division Kazan bacterium]